MIPLLLLQGHLAENQYDGYAPHHHMMLLDLSFEEYEKYHQRTGNVFADKTLASIVHNPWRSGFVRKILEKTYDGYDYCSQVEPTHKDLYAFNGLHDGVDVLPFQVAPQPLLGQFYSTYTNINGTKSSVAVYEVHDCLENEKTGEIGRCWVWIGALFVQGVLVDGKSYVHVKGLTDAAMAPRPVWDERRLTVEV